MVLTYRDLNCTEASPISRTLKSTIGVPESKSSRSQARGGKKDEVKRGKGVGEGTGSEGESGGKKQMQTLMIWQ